MADTRAANQAFYSLEVEGVGSKLHVLNFTGREYISRPFFFNIHVETDDAEIDPASVIGQKAEFAMESNGHERTISGVVTRFSFSGTEREKTIYDLRIAPPMEVLRHRYNCRIFQEKTVTDIISDVFDLSQAFADPFRISTQDDRDPLTYCVQYRESDFNFVNRLAEESGLFYFILFDDGSNELVIADNADVHPQIPGGSIQFHVPGGRLTDQDFVHGLHIGLSLRTSLHTVRDYNYVSPDLDLTSDHSGEGDSTLECYDYPGRYSTQDAGANLAEYKSQVDDCLRSICRGHSNSVRLAPGYLFDLTDHPNTSVNDSYLVTVVEHEGSQPSPESASNEQLGYNNRIQFQKADIPFRARMITPRPRIYGSQTATVSGPDGHEIYSDEYGRVKVRFHWDRSDTAGDSCSCWIRTTQKWAGKSWGGMFIPRIGQEVLVEFIEGDPDRPVIAGCVYNGTNVTPYPLPDEQTKSTIKTESSMGGDGYNEIRFEDKKGSEQLYIQAEKDYDTLTKNNKTAKVDANESLSVKKDRSRSVGGNESVSVSGKRTHSVGKDENITVSDNQTVSVGKDRTTSVGKNESVDIGESNSVKVGKDSTVNIGKNETVSVGDESSLDVGKDMKVSVGKKYGLSAGDAIVINSDKEITLKCGKASIVMKKSGDITIKGKKITMKGSGDITLKGSKINAN